MKRKTVAVQLAGGMGMRMRPLTKKMPKSMLHIHGKPILEHIISVYPKNIKTVILLVYPHQKNMIRKHFGDKFQGKKIIYVPDKDLKNRKGNWQALINAKKHIQNFDNFLFLCGDDIHKKSSLEKLVNYNKDAILGFEHTTPEKFGVLSSDKNNFLIEIEEKPEIPKSNLVSTGVWLFDTKILNEKDPEKINDEYRITEVVKNYLKHTKIKVIKSDGWQPVGSPEEFIQAHDSPLFEQS